MNKFYRTEAGKFISIEEALEQRLVGVGGSAPGTFWMNGRQVPFNHAVESGIIDQAAADYLASLA